MIFENSLEILSHITNPVTVAIVGAFLSLAIVKTASKIKGKAPSYIWLVAVTIFLLSISPIISRTYLQLWNIYQLHVTVLGNDHQPVENAEVISSAGGELKKLQSGWEFDIRPQAHPSDGRVTVFATVKSAFLAGSSEIVLADDYFPGVTVQLKSDTSGDVRGVVLDEHSRPVAKARVSVAGYSEMADSDQMGNFSLAAHAADGQFVDVGAQKGQRFGSERCSVGRTCTLVIAPPKSK